MNHGKRDPDLLVRAIMVLGRVPNLPTIWSNCLAGWLLSGGGSAGAFTVLWWGATFLYLGGVFLNEVCATDEDWAHRNESPIAAGIISRETVLFLSLGFFGFGSLLLVTLGTPTAFIVVLIVVNSVLYSLTHRWILISPLLITIGRFLLYLLAGTATEHGLQGLTVWSGIVLACYTLVMSTLTSRDRILPGFGNWFLLLLALPVVLALLVNGEGYLVKATVAIVIYTAWVLWCLRYVFSKHQRNVPYAASGLLPGIILVDFLALAGGSPGIIFVLLLWFSVALAAQRLLPQKLIIQ